MYSLLSFKKIGNCTDKLSDSGVTILKKMEAKEKLTDLKRRAFARFKSHSYDVTPSSNILQHNLINNCEKVINKSTLINKENEKLGIESVSNVLSEDLSSKRAG